jgi:hypothetical protein
MLLRSKQSTPLQIATLETTMAKDPLLPMTALACVMILITMGFLYLLGLR